jgi:hypothetical protein
MVAAGAPAGNICFIYLLLRACVHLVVVVLFRSSTSVSVFEFGVVLQGIAGT